MNGIVAIIRTGVGVVKWPGRVALVVAALQCVCVMSCVTQRCSGCCIETLDRAAFAGVCREQETCLRFQALSYGPHSNVAAQCITTNTVPVFYRQEGAQLRIVPADVLVTVSLDRPTVELGVVASYLQNISGWSWTVTEELQHCVMSAGSWTGTLPDICQELAQAADARCQILQPGDPLSPPQLNMVPGDHIATQAP